LGWPSCSDAYDSGASAVAYWLGRQVAHSRPNGCPEITWGRTLKKALKYKGLPVNFKEWRAIAEDRSEWRSKGVL